MLTDDTRYDNEYDKFGSILTYLIASNFERNNNTINKYCQFENFLIIWIIS